MSADERNTFLLIFNYLIGIATVDISLGAASMGKTKTKKEGDHHRSVCDGRFSLARMTAVSVLALVLFNLFQFDDLMRGNKELRDALNAKDDLLKTNDELLRGNEKLKDEIKAKDDLLKAKDELSRRNEKNLKAELKAKDDLLKTKDELFRGNKNELGDGEHTNNLDLYPAYASLLEEAERRADANFESSHRRGKLGVMIGPTEGNFLRNTMRSLRNAKRIRGILDAENKSGIVKVAMMASPAHIGILKNCENNNNNNNREACRLWANGTLVDDLIATKDDYYFEIRDAVNDTAADAGSIRFMLVEVSSYRLAPYETTLFIDSDAYPCPGFDKLFGVLLPEHNKKYWQLPVWTVGDFAIGLEQWPYDGYHKFWLPGPPDNLELVRDYRSFSTRNTGAVLFHFGRKVAHVFAEYIPLVTQYLHNNVSTPKMKVAPNDQMPFRQALYTFRKLRPDFVEMQLPMHSSCRTYPGISYAGTDGFLNGMFPLLPDGTRCSDCYCTPCLIAHTPTYFVTINGTNGWDK